MPTPDSESKTCDGVRPEILTFHSNRSASRPGLESMFAPLRITRGRRLRFFEVGPQQNDFAQAGSLIGDSAQPLYPLRLCGESPIWLSIHVPANVNISGLTPPK
jgi:hypothetical protein